MATLCMYSIYLSIIDLLSYTISNTDKHEFSRIWKWISRCNEFMNHVDRVIKLDMYFQKMQSCSKNMWYVIFCSKNICVI